MIRVLIVDGQDEVRRGLRMRLAVEPDMAIIGETGDVEEALSLARSLGPDVIVVDIGMRGADGANMVKRLREVAPAASAVVLTLDGDANTRARAQEAGARAFLDKHGGSADLLQTIRRIAPGQLLAKSAATGPLATRRQSVGQTWNENRTAASEYKSQQRRLWSSA
jgi:DNA-binding NarL/FixJ family response regulator